jgi:tetratricopeptide (TPR) repeat protein
MRNIYFLIPLFLLLLTGCFQLTVPVCYDSEIFAMESPPSSELSYQEEYDVKVQITVAILLFGQEEYAIAAKEIEKVLAIDPTDAGAYMVGSGIYWQLNEPQVSLEYALQAIQFDHYLRGPIRSTLVGSTDIDPLDTYSEVLMCLNSNVESFSDNSQVFYERGMFYFLFGYHEQAIVDFLKAIELDDSVVNIMFYGSIAYLDLGQHQKAAELITMAIQKAPENWLYYQLRGDLFVLMDEVSLAINDYERMLEFCDTRESCKLANRKVTFYSEQE